jgi:hypothetical protein
VRLRKTVLETHGKGGIVCTGRKDCLLVLVVSVTFERGDESSAEQRRAGSSREGLVDGGSISDAASGDNRFFLPLLNDDGQSDV